MSVEDFVGEFKELYDLFGKSCLSPQKDYDCGGKPCACLVCRHEDYFCVEGDPCYDCKGEDKDRISGFCNPSDEELDD